MAGHGPPTLRHDPAIDRWNSMRENVYLHYKWTPRATRTVLIGAVVIPTLLYYTLSNQDTKWQWTAKRKGESLARVSTPEAE
ncbi:hypothetical protein PUNSTDRAFT_135092 [Punctularia strigosozonata HHB-11173 SS5]|uniref:uncharacterized protein n=1 Tax=Punctularia strigosozonata (strain HHB-11173) TaxID=741275 RepID=UPI0004416F23|nr:uncharacterized protein PUNSTDRAFT_135092 [Punctularia strigosozonata HHB-11173 SS5]EIN07566.1 hypothetical protein PUNSTDRAFT_135092 [Punctularia strigosozonata HHB-11173 SS5]